MDRKTRALALIPALLALGLSGAAAQPGPSRPAPRWPLVTLTPPDIEARDPELARVRDRLLAAITARDLAGVRALMAPTVRDQDTDVRVDEVLTAMGPLAPGTPLSEEWLALAQGLRLGGVRRETTYVVPFMALAARARRDAINEVFVAGRDVAVRESPSGAAAIVARVSNAVLRAALVSDASTSDDASGCRAWTAVVTAASRVGWVCAADTRAMTGLYYDFVDVGGSWRLRALWAVDPLVRPPGKAPPPASAADIDPGLASLRERILEAADRAAIEPLVPLMTPTFLYDLGVYTPASFLAETRTWSAADRKDFWCEVRDALALPMVASGETAYAPYVALVEPPAQSWLVVTRDRVKVRSAPSASAAVVDELSYDIVEEIYDGAYARVPPAVIGGCSVRVASGGDAERRAWVGGGQVRPESDGLPVRVRQGRRCLAHQGLRVQRLTATPRRLRRDGGCA